MFLREMELAPCIINERAPVKHTQVVNGPHESRKFPTTQRISFLIEKSESYLRFGINRIHLYYRKVI